MLQRALFRGIAHFAKMLVPDSCVDYLAILWNTTLDEGCSVRLADDCVVTCSPPGSHFPGTEDRVLCIRTQSFDTLVCRAKEVIMACVLLRGSSHRPLGEKGREQGLEKQTLDGRAGIRLAVPRKVVGTVIGKGGSHIQTLRQSTQAVIHISPLFVTSEYACSERVISISANLGEFDALQQATLTLLKMVNKHPERASCQRTIYKRHE
ncbi:putative KH domain protein [Gregarina niphandrodes]|uniref:KH domain protein n=1 Tax=Gregarina niphandrodes TaxID=110365 RepID=A0A023B1A2_GRENI|nr:putative KH domain protein [Gregarina niphandrodes]EZG45469.1 putative KH domain protein [Gregarina niphandrodes]|eukprot:XP_011132487.1 putative KH domain protein [Gregarina niphandrodes]